MRLTSAQYHDLARRAMVLAYRKGSRRAYDLAVIFCTRSIAERMVDEILYGETPRNIRGYGKSIISHLLAASHRAQGREVMVLDFHVDKSSALHKMIVDECVVPVKERRHYSDLNDDWRGKKGKFR